MRKYLLSLMVLVLCGLFLAVNVGAEQWQIVGPRALGMGGANVAVVNDATASYWNPAAFGFFGQNGKKDDKDEHSDKVWGVNVVGGAGVQLQGNVAEQVNDVLNFKFSDLSTKAKAGTITQSDLADFTRMVGEIKDLNGNEIGLNATVNMAVATRFKNFGVGAYGLAELGADPNIDIVNLGIEGASTSLAITNISGLASSTPIVPTVLTPTQYTDLINAIKVLPGWTSTTATSAVNALEGGLSSAGVTSVPDKDIQAFKDVAQTASNLVSSTGGGNLSNNNTNILFKGAGVLEVPVSYGHAFNDNFSIGGNVKYMEAMVYYKNVKVFDKDKNDFFKNAFDDFTRSTNFGVDLGLLAKLSDFRLGLVGRNLNSPKFAYAGPGDYQIDAQVRAGVAYMPASWLTLAVDADVLKNDTPFAGFDSQNIGAGVELRVWNFLSLRGGILKNIAMSNSDPAYTAGLGFNFWGANLDIGAAVSSKNTNINGTTIPQEARLEAAFSLQY